jgi:ribonuclease PH
MALMDAGVPLIMKVLALQIVSVEADFTVDPDAQQESLICSGPGARHTIVLAANSNNDFNNIIAWDGVGDFAGTLAYMQSSVAAVTSNSDESEAAAPKYLSLVQSEFSKTYIRRIPVENINN